MKEKQELTLKEEWREKHFLRTLVEGQQLYRVPINWVQERFTLKKGVMHFRKGRRKIYLAFCMATKHLINMEWNVLLPLMMHETHVITKNGEPVHCEEGRRCLNIDCPLNRTTKESFASETGISKEMNWEAVTSYRKLEWE